MRILKSLLAVSVLMSAATADASIAPSGYVSGIYAMSNGAVLFNSSGAGTARPSCQGSTLGSRWAFDASTSAGQAKLSLLLTAYALRKPIVIVGTGACSAWNDTETADYFTTDG